MPTSIIHRAVTAALVFCSLGLFAQSKPAAVYKPAPTLPLQLNLTLSDLTRVASATNQDLSQLHQGRLHWVAFWRRDSAHRAQISAALRRNLQFAVPNLIHDAQVSGGSISTTFKLYRDLSVVAESLDSLLPPGSRDGHDVAALNNDLAEMNRIREGLSSYIQQTAMSFESKNPQLVLSAGGFPKKIIIDDTVPERPAKRRRAASQ